VDAARFAIDQRVPSYEWPMRFAPTTFSAAARPMIVAAEGAPTRRADESEAAAYVARVAV
jgi:hypothetical protein